MYIITITHRTRTARGWKAGRKECQTAIDRPAVRAITLQMRRESWDSRHEEKPIAHDYEVWDTTTGENIAAGTTRAYGENAPGTVAPRAY